MAETLASDMPAAGYTATYSTAFDKWRLTVPCRPNHAQPKDPTEFTAQY